MPGYILPMGDGDEQDLGFARVTWLAGPADESEHLTVIDFSIKPGEALPFHTHPQDEFLYVLEGTVEQWIEDEMTLVGPGDAVFAPAGTVHASYNASDDVPARGLVIFGPSADNEMGFESEDVSDQAPWNQLRG